MNFGNATNNEAEYEGLLHGMRMAIACGANRLTIYGDSILVVHQTMNKCDAVSDQMVAYRDMYNLLEGSFDGCELCHVGRASNEEADERANIGSTCAPIPPGVFLEQIYEWSVKVKPAAGPSKETAHSGSASSACGEAPTSADEPVTPTDPAMVYLIEQVWTGPYLAYLTRQKVPEDPAEARRIIRRSKAYT